MVLSVTCQRGPVCLAYAVLITETNKRNYYLVLGFLCSHTSHLSLLQLLFKRGYLKRM